MLTVHRTILALLLTVPLATAGAAAQRPSDAELLFQAAGHAELIEGDLEQAIRLYRDLLDRFAADRVVAAQALIRLGACYEKIGHRDARDAYQRVLREYADQAQAATIARARLQAFEEATGSSAGPTYRIVMHHLAGVSEVLHAPPPYAFAPDGTRFVIRRPDLARNSPQLFLVEADGAVVRPLVETTGDWWGFQDPRWSPDGTRVAYLAQKAPYDVRGPWGIFVTTAGTGEAVQIGPDFPEGARIASLCWTADGREITYAARGREGAGASPEGLYSRSVETGESRLIEAMPVHWTMWLGGYSPDSRWLAYHQADRSGAQAELDVWILPARGGRAVRVTDTPGPDAQPAWAPDGDALYFVSRRGGDGNVWKIRLDPRRGLPAGAAQQITFFRDGQVTHPAVFAAGRRMGLALFRRQTAIQIADPARPQDARGLARGVAPQLSPDGATVYFIGEGPDRQGLFSISSSGGSPKRLTSSPPASGFDLSPDGQALAYYRKEGGRMHLYTVAVSGGEPRLIAKDLGSTQPIAPPRWSPDGSLIAFAHEQTLFTIRAAGGERRHLAQLHQWQEWLWAPDGRSLAALAYEGPGDIGVFVVPAQGGEPRRLTPPDQREYKEGLSWHPGGRRVAYMTYVGAGGRDSEVREAHVDGTLTTLLQVPGEWEYVGRWTPDGSEYVFVSYPPGRTVFYAQDATSGERRVLADGVALGVGGLGHGLASWSADRRLMVWARGNDSGQLWIAENFR